MKGRLLNMGFHYKPMLIAVFVFVGLLSGCTNNTETIQSGIGEAVEGIRDTVQDTALDLSDELKRNGIHQEISYTQEVDHSVSALQVDHEVGNIVVKGTSDDKIKVTATIWSLDKASRDDKYQEIMDHAEISVVVNGDQLEVVTHPKGNEKLNMWKWAKKEYGFSNFSIDYMIEIPDRVKNYDISSEVGEINLSNLRGVYDVHNNVGSVSIEGAQIEGKSSIVSETGSLQLGIDQMQEDSSLKVRTEVGAIVANLAESLQCSLETKTEVGSITGASKGKSDINGGGPLLLLTSSVGSITVN